MSVDDEYERISQILAPGKPLEEPPEVNLKTLRKYYQFLQGQLSPGPLMTGRETMGYFSWEERFEWGRGDKTEHRQLTQEHASCDDQFKFISVHQGDEDTGISTKLMRTSDDKVFDIPLADLEICDEKSTQWQTLEDYATWFVNFGGADFF